jgi:AbrB family looped-hinge helix DNA binding protein
MASHGLPTTTVSTKGQVILPKAVRAHRNWPPGTRLVVEETTDGVVLRPAASFPATAPAEVFASLPSPDGTKTIEEMDAGLLAEARRRHAGD